MYFCKQSILKIQQIEDKVKLAVSAREQLSKNLEKAEERLKTEAIIGMQERAKLEHEISRLTNMYSFKKKRRNQ